MVEPGEVIARMCIRMMKEHATQRHPAVILTAVLTMGMQLALSDPGLASAVIGSLGLPTSARAEGDQLAAALREALEHEG